MLLLICLKKHENENNGKVILEKIKTKRDEEENFIIKCKRIRKKIRGKKFQKELKRKKRERKIIRVRYFHNFFLQKKN